MEETLICAIWWYKAGINKDIPKQILCKDFLSNLDVLFLELKNVKYNCEWVHLSKVAHFYTTTLLKHELLCRFLFFVFDHNCRTTTSQKISLWYNSMNIVISCVLFYCFLFIIGQSYFISILGHYYKVLSKF